MDKSYRQYHSLQMHSNGTTSYETLGGVIPSFIYLFTAITLASLLSSYTTAGKRTIFLLEFATIIIPTILHITLLADYIRELTIATTILTLLLVYYISTFKQIPSNTPATSATKIKTYLTNFRAAVNISSVIAILAVDFRCFPRRFAKTESYGYSLMDVGVGLFMVANGVVAPELRGRYDSFRASLKSSIPLFVLGGARFLLTKQSDYNVPVSEYGVHWNFFITLAVTKVFTSCLLNVFKVEYIQYNAAVLLIAHETLLQAGLKRFALSESKRTNFVLANKEGLVSSLGYIALYLFAVHFGYLINKYCGVAARGRNLLKFAATSLVLYLMTVSSGGVFGVSRRLANSTYCFWILFLSTFMIGLFYLGETVQLAIYRTRLRVCWYTPFIFEAVNYNGLVYFLLGNLLTGLVNFGVNTLHVGVVGSVAVIVGYMFVNCAVICWLYHKQIKLKL